jgi:nifR3 family TIM-barrel protein
MGTWKIRDLTIANQIVIAPLAGISNPAFRTIAKEFGAGLVYSEMISDKAIVYKNKKTLAMCHIEQSEHPIALQLFGEDIASMVQAAIYLDTQTDCDIIDINMGCPVPKIIKGSGGASLMKDPQHAADIVRAIVAAVTKPVTVKIRIGWDNQHLSGPHLAKLLEEAGASAIAVHGRTRSAMYGR